MTELDARGLICPLPVLKARKALKHVAVGEVLAVLVGLGLSHPEAGFYQDACDAGGTLVVVEAEDRYRAAQLILERNGSCDPYSDGEGGPEDAGPLLVGMPLPLNPDRN